MFGEMWSWLLGGTTIVALWLAGRRSWTGWAIGLASEPLWMVYAVWSRQWGFLAMTGAYTWVYARNFLLWRRQEQTCERRTAVAAGVSP